MYTHVTFMSTISDLACTVKPPNKGHIGDGPFFPCKEVVHFSEVYLLESPLQKKLTLNCFNVLVQYILCICFHFDGFFQLQDGKSNTTCINIYKHSIVIWYTSGRRGNLCSGC